jgi:hypothetical protein
MTLPFTLPDWAPWWVTLSLLVVAALFGLAFLAMPFSVLGIKPRLEAIEIRLDEIQGEIRSLTLRLPEFRPERDDARPPIPPARHPPSDGYVSPPREGRPQPPTRLSRQEPRF